MKQISSATSVLMLLTWAAAAKDRSADTGFYDNKEEGWFWREPEPTPMPMPSEPPLQALVDIQPSMPSELLPVSQQAPATPAAFSPEWMREKLPVYRDRALQDPTPENVRAYFYLQRHAMNMAERFALVAQKVVLADPSLDENTRRPISTYGGQVFDAVARENTVRAAAKIARMAGVWYFYKSTCPYCAAQNPVLERLQRRIGLAVLPIALDGQAMPDSVFSRFVPNQGHAQQLNVSQTPTLYLVRKPNEFVLLSEGLVTDEALLDRIVYAAHDAKWITQEEFDSTRAARPSAPVLTTQEISEEVLADPIKLIEVLQTHDSSVTHVDDQQLHMLPPDALP